MSRKYERRRESRSGVTKQARAYLVAGGVVFESVDLAGVDFVLFVGVVDLVFDVSVFDVSVFVVSVFVSFDGAGSFANAGVASMATVRIDMMVFMTGPMVHRRCRAPRVISAG
jgi:hypothetical protein